MLNLRGGESNLGNNVAHSPLRQLLTVRLGGSASTVLHPVASSVGLLSIRSTRSRNTGVVVVAPTNDLRSSRAPSANEIASLAVPQPASAFVQASATLDRPIFCGCSVPSVDTVEDSFASAYECHWNILFNKVHWKADVTEKDILSVGFRNADDLRYVMTAPPAHEDIYLNLRRLLTPFGLGRFYRSLNPNFKSPAPNSGLSSPAVLPSPPPTSPVHPLLLAVQVSSRQPSHWGKTSAAVAIGGAPADPTSTALLYRSAKQIRRKKTPLDQQHNTFPGDSDRGHVRFHSVIASVWVFRGSAPACLASPVVAIQCVVRGWLVRQRGAVAPVSVRFRGHVRFHSVIASVWVFRGSAPACLASPVVAIQCVVRGWLVRQRGAVVPVSVHPRRSRRWSKSAQRKRLAAPSPPVLDYSALDLFLAELAAAPPSSTPVPGGRSVGLPTDKPIDLGGSTPSAWKLPVPTVVPQHVGLHADVDGVAAPFVPTASSSSPLPRKPPWLGFRHFTAIGVLLKALATAGTVSMAQLRRDANAVISASLGHPVAAALPRAMDIQSMYQPQHVVAGADPLPAGDHHINVPALDALHVSGCVFCQSCDPSQCLPQTTVCGSCY